MRRWVSGRWVVAACVFISGTVASASDEGPPPASAWERELYEARPVERPLTLPRGWTELETGVRWQRVDGGFGSDGTRAAGPRGRTQTVGFAARVGVTRHVEAFARWGVAHHSRPGVNAWGVTAPEVGARVQLIRDVLPNASLAVDVSASPAWGGGVLSTLRGVRFAGRLADAQGVSFTRGTTELSAMLRFRRQLDALRLDVSIGTRQPLGGPRLFAGGIDAIVHIDLAAATVAEVSALFQMGPFALQAGLSSSRWGADRIDEGPLPNSGWHVVGELGGVISLTRGVDVRLRTRRVLRGRPSFFFVNEALSPGYGPDAHVTVTWRL